MKFAFRTQGPSAACPDERALSDFSCGKLPVTAAETIAEHIGNCRACESLLVGLDQRTDPLLAALRESAAAETCSEVDCTQIVKLVAAMVDGASEHAALPKESPPAESVAPSPLHQIGCYELLSQLGEGGMGTVFKARHIHLDKIVAVKRLAPGYVRDRLAVARFQREMRAIGQLEHPNIVGARDAGESGGVHFLVMDYIDGVDLTTLARRIGRLPVAEACEIIRQAACGLQHAHDNGLVHRDVKPSNLMLSSSGQVKLLDLGLALLAVDSADDELTTSMALGTVDYMAPEQANNSHCVDIRADLYGLGCTLYRLLAGHAPFVAPVYDTPAKKLLAHATAPVPRLRDVRPDVPAELDSIVQRLLAKAPSRRYPTPAEVMAALAPFTVGYDFSRLDSPSTASVLASCPPRPARPRSWAATVCLAALLTVAFVVFKTRDAKPPPNPAVSDTPSLTTPAGNPPHPIQTATTLEDSPRRKAAEWVLSIGGSLTICQAGQKIEVDDPGYLPGGAFSVLRVVLSHNERLRDEDVVDLLKLGNLQILNLSYTQVSDTGLATLRGLTTLTIVDLAATRVSDVGLEFLADNSNLRTLRLTSTGITDAGLVHISGLTHLADLQLGGTPITDAGLVHLRGLTELVDLYLHDTLITDAGLIQLQGLTKLRRLWVGGSSISDVGVAQIAKLRELTALSLRGSRLTDAGLENLEGLPNLTELLVERTNVTDAGIRRFLLAKPDCHLRYGATP